MMPNILVVEAEVLPGQPFDVEIRVRDQRDGPGHPFAPEPLALGLSPGCWRVRLRDGEGSVRMGPASGVGFAYTEEPPLELRLLLAQAAERPAAIEVDGECDLKRWSETLDVPFRAAPTETVAPVVPPFSPEISTCAAATPSG